MSPRGGVAGYYLVDADGRPALGQFGESVLFVDWVSAAGAASQIGGRLIPLIPAPQPTADGPRRGRPKKVEAE